MHLPLTLGLFALLTAALFALRLRWPYLSSRTHRRILIVASVALTLQVLSRLSGFGISLPRLNSLLYWVALASLELFILLLSLLPPRPLTSLISAVLLLPLLSSSAFLPLTDLFFSAPATVVPLGEGLLSVRRPFAPTSPSYVGVELLVIRPLPWLPFVRRTRQAARFLNSQCNAFASTAILQPDHLHVRMICPPWPTSAGLGGTDLVVTLY